MMTARQLRVMFVLFTILFLIMKVMVNASVAVDVAPANPLFPAMFVFGDSLLDPGNRAHLATTSPHLPVFLSGSKYPPYGRDFPSHLPTGRYSNGLLLSDILARFFELPYPPPYITQKDNVTQGTSFAYGGAVIFNIRRTYRRAPRIDLYDQVSFFKNVQEQLLTTMHEDDASGLTSKSLFLICIGSNDYLINYFSNPLGQSFAQKRYSAIEFREKLISLYRQSILRLYDLGARKFAIISIPPIGCTPIMKFLFSRAKNIGCIDFINEEVKEFNLLLLEMTIELQSAYQSAHFTYLNSYDHVLEIIQDPKAFGFMDSSKPCCALGPYGGVPICSKSLNSICNNASEYVYWDFAHPTERVYSLAADWFLQGSPPDVHPINLQQISSL